MYTFGAGLQLCLHCTFLLSFAGPWVNVKLLQLSQLKHDRGSRGTYVSYYCMEFSVYFVKLF